MHPCLDACCLLMFCLAEHLWLDWPGTQRPAQVREVTCATHGIKAAKRESEVLDCDVPWEPEPGPR